MSLVFGGQVFLFLPDRSDMRGIIGLVDHLMSQRLIIAFVQTQMLRFLWGNLRTFDDDGFQGLF